MSNTLKIAFSVIGLVLIGFLAGYQTHRSLVKNRMKRVAKERISPGFVDRMMDILEIRKDQAPQVAPILENYSNQLIESRRVEMARRKPILDSMRQDLVRILDDGQEDKLDRVIERMKKTKRHRHKERGASPKREK